MVICFFTTETKSTMVANVQGSWEKVGASSVFAFACPPVALQCSRRTPAGNFAHWFDGCAGNTRPTQTQCTWYIQHHWADVRKPCSVRSQSWTCTRTRGELGKSGRESLAFSHS